MTPSAEAAKITDGEAWATSRTMARTMNGRR
jgi:hypothetical protein